MKQIIEFVPIALFFIVYQLDGESISLGTWTYQFDGIFSATAVLMAATVAQVIVTYAITREFEKRLFWLLAAVVVFGGATLLWRNQAFIQWKPTVFNWGMALVFGASQFIGGKNLMERMLGSQIHLPRQVWTQLNALWVANFFIVGTLNIIVAYQFSEETWVNYKFYSFFVFIVIITALTAMLISPHLKEDENGEQILQRDE